MAKFELQDKKPMKRGRPAIGSDTEKVRNKRTPIFDQHDRHWFPKNPAYYRVWVTDTKNQVNDFLRWGFTFVDRAMLDEEEGRAGEGDSRNENPVDTRVQMNVGRAHVKDNAIAYLMQMPMDEWLECKQAIAEERQRPMREIKEGVASMKQQGFYGEGVKQTVGQPR